MWFWKKKTVVVPPVEEQFDYSISDPALNLFLCRLSQLTKMAQEALKKDAEIRGVKNVEEADVERIMQTLLTGFKELIEEHYETGLHSS